MTLLCYAASPWRKLSPGPLGIPLLGNVSVFTDKRWLVSEECRKQYGTVMHLNVLGKPMLIINSQKAAGDLLERRGNVYSDRPELIVSNGCQPFHLGMTSYGDLFRRMRKASQEGFMKSVVKDYNPVQELEALILTVDILKTPALRHRHFRRSAASMIMSVVYANPIILSEEDPKVRDIEAHIDRLVQVMTPSVMTQMFPWLRYISRNYHVWKRQALEGYAKDSAMFESLVDQVRDDLSIGIERPSFSATLIRDQQHNGLSDRENAWLAGNMFTAGAETTAGAMSWFTLAMATHSPSQARAQAELDAIVGRARPPTFADLPCLPYIRALVKEVLRWRPILPLGMPHRVREHDWYNGAFVPAGTTAFVNVWLCNTDPAAYGADARAFRPERHLEGPPPPETREEGHVAFGFGKRVCVGRHVANNSLFINIATLLWAATIAPAKSADGTEIPIDVDGFVDDGMIFRPKSFECTVIPRFPEVLPLLKAELELRGHDPASTDA
ncbi:cytochrome P450 [Vararia minispora EC-137]|uniref:Cytochrome P450 n=1 Tax=Vararia minispora EC-137 TaxID=1314806 RepID=A0ACB8QXL3_9AGAM|nr:cytochrome P450 [Vararia minispora EC-137]